MIDLVRTSLHRAITTQVGDQFLPIRVPKDLARRFNILLGEPLCDAAELERRRSAEAKLEALKNGTAAASAPVKSAQAPVMIYFERDRNVRLLGRVRELLDAKQITYTELDVSGDDATRMFVMREAKCKEDDLPVVFVAGAAVGGFNDLVEWDVSGRLAKAIRA